MKALVGYTGFVGSNLYATENFDEVYNSQNIQEAFGTSPDLLVYAGLRAEKYLANSEPEKDRRLIEQAKENIRQINPKKLILISTIDVFKRPKNVDETSEIDTKDLQPYGLHRYFMELWVRENYPNALIVRLPGLFGKNIKKNFIYDYLSVIPFMLQEKKWDEFSEKIPNLRDYYFIQKNNFYQVKALSESEREILKRKFREIGFSAVQFTDSRSYYQFYNLNRLWNDIEIALYNKITLLHLATEPIRVDMLYQYLTGKNFVNELEGIPADYDFRTVFGSLLGGDHFYIDSAEHVLEQIKNFVEEMQK